MNKTSIRLLIPVLFLVLTVFSVCSASTECLDINGNRYTTDAPGYSLCYYFDGNGYVTDGTMTLEAWRNANGSAPAEAPVERIAEIPTEAPAVPREFPTPEANNYQAPEVVPEEKPRGNIIITPEPAEEQILPVVTEPVFPNEGMPQQSLFGSQVPEVIEEPQVEITKEVTVEVTEEATVEVTRETIVEVTGESTVEATEEPTSAPTEEATIEATEEPTSAPTEETTIEATEEPTGEATVEPTEETTSDPTGEPTTEPTEESTADPNADPTAEVSETPTAEPTEQLTLTPVIDPTVIPGTGPMLMSVSLEGSLSELTLTAPDNGAVLKNTSTVFTWVYSVSDKKHPVDVDFTLDYKVIDGSNNTTEVSISGLAANCKDAVCTYGPITFADKDHVYWKVTGSYLKKSQPVSVTSDTYSFSIDSGVTPEPTPIPAPGKPVQECPKGDYDTTSIGFYWAPSKNARTYSVSWKNDHGDAGTLSLSNDDVTCQKNRCIVHATLPCPGNYSWTVKAINENGEAVSSAMQFRILRPLNAPTAYSPSGSIHNRSYPTFQWSDVSNAYDYRLQVVGKYDNRIRFDQWIPADSVYRGHGSCSYNSGIFLPSGTYSWRVMAGDGKGGASGWSGWRDFTVVCDYCNYNNAYYNSYANTVPTPSYPTATITTLSPEFQWRTLTGASYYILNIFDNNGRTLHNVSVPNSYCTYELCTFDPKLTLPGNGAYTWSIAGYSAAGALWGSAKGAFTVAAEIKQNDISFLIPEQNGYLDEVTPMIFWTDPGSGTSYFTLSFTDKNNNVLLNTTLSRGDAWCDGNTCAIEFKTIPDGENYKLTVTPYSEYNTAGKPVTLSFNKGAQPISLISPKEGSTVPQRPLFRWVLSEGENVTYVLNLTDSAQETTIFLLNCGADGVNCEDGVGFFTPEEALSSGAYTAVVTLAGKPIGNNFTTFTVR